MAFLDSLDIANRACQHLGAPRIQNPSEDSVNNAEISFAYDKLRRAELQRNVWRFAIRKAVLRPIDTTTYILAPAQWNVSTYYPPGSIVADANGTLWFSTQANNIGNAPGSTNVWEDYFGPMTVDVYDTTGGTAYWAGDLVYMPGTNSSYNIYMSLQNANTETPNVADMWNATTTYQQDETVSYSGTQWRSLIALNLNNIPIQGPANWASSQTYASGTQVTGSDGYIYTSVSDGNLGNNPVTDGGGNWTNTNVPNAWTSTPMLPASSSIWVPIYAALQTINLVYPLSAGPLSQSLTKNIFRLPAGFLKRAPQDPKAGQSSFLGAPSNRMIEDWELDGDWIVTQQATPIILRFVADIQTVTKMDDMFCEGLAARLGVECCQPITNSTAKQQTCNNMYKMFMTEARMVNAIEEGLVEPPEDDYITCRI